MKIVLSLSSNVLLLVAIVLLPPQPVAVFLFALGGVVAGVVYRPARDARRPNRLVWLSDEEKAATERNAEVSLSILGALLVFAGALSALSSASIERRTLFGAIEYFGAMMLGSVIADVVRKKHKGTT